MRALGLILVATCALGASASWADCRVAPLRDGVKLSPAALELRGAIFMHLCSRSAATIVDADDATLQERIVKPAPAFVPRADEFYPAEAIRQNKQGTVVHILVVEVDGKVSQYALIESSGSDLLDKAAVMVIAGMRLKGPGLLDGVPTRMIVTVPILFALR